ncbi:hypothetical protein ONR75_24080 [Rhodopseudomonas sp. P2A-2r]|uniref:hypothetical protein n=1 Tax=Rhodopseudomonas sp. P2A-2r TaxID=2991972 RepID=UPI002234C9B2|nr:hypothetical protein [Rhodopseudomonas sp. P2A-2r]UZE47918.1 hypothetical protein ONR75_24080 [Rhodopseudomonas sp. P2A-2r]
MNLVQKYMGGAAFLRAPEGDGGGGGDGGGQGGQQNGGGQQQNSGQGSQQQNGNGQGGQQQAWYASHNFDADTQAWIEERKFPDLNETLKAGREGSKLARDRNVIPKPDLKNVKEWTGFQELGWTPDREKYQVNKPQLEQGEQFDDGFFNKFTEIAHGAKLLPWQAEIVSNGLHAEERRIAKEAATRGTAAKRELEGKLRTDWGADYDAKVEGAKRAFAFLGGEDFKPEEIEAAIGSPRTAKLFAKLFDLIGEDSMPAAGNGNMAFQRGETVGALQAEINNNWANPDWKKAFDDPRNARHADVKAQHQNLLERKAALELKARGGKAA